MIFSQRCSCSLVLPNTVHTCCYPVILEYTRSFEQFSNLLSSPPLVPGAANVKILYIGRPSEEGDDNLHIPLIVQILLSYKPSRVTGHKVNVNETEIHVDRKDVCGNFNKSSSSSVPWDKDGARNEVFGSPNLLRE